MLRCSSRTAPASRTPRASRGLAGALLAGFAFALLGLPGLASAASFTVPLSDPDGSGVGATLVFDDDATPGSLSISIESDGATAADILGISIIHDVFALHPQLDATGTDVGDVVSFFLDKDADDCPCETFVDLGGDGLLEATGLDATSIVVGHPTETVSLQPESLGGAAFRLYLAYAVGSSGRGSDDRPYDGGDIRLRKVILEGEIPAIPEPSTAAMMMLGLIGLAVGTQRLA